MSTNYGLFRKKATPFRMNMEQSKVREQLAQSLQTYLDQNEKHPLILLCIGTDRSTGDSLGPLTGSKLEAANLNHFITYGTLSDPVHAVNMVDKIKSIYDAHDNPYIIAIDACLGKVKSVGDITLASGPLSPGAAVKKELPAIGDIHLTGIVNVGGMMEYAVLQNTRLHLVMSMADIISDACKVVDRELTVQKRRKATKTHIEKKISLADAFSFLPSEKFKL